MIRHGRTVAALATVGALLLAGCRSDDGGTQPTSAPTTTATAATETTAGAETVATEPSTGETAAPSTGETTPASDAPDTTTVATDAPAEAWIANTDDCPSSVTDPIEGEIKIGSAMPLSGPVAGGYKPVADGLQAYIDYANANNLVDGHTLTLDTQDDQYDPNLTPGAISTLIDGGASLMTGILGSDNNLAVRDTLNEECIPQLLALTGSPDWGDVESYPWTTGALVPYDIETAIYAKELKKMGVTTVGVYRINNEFGKVFSESFIEAADAEGLEIIDDQTVELGDNTPPKSQVEAFARSKPDAIVAVPLSLQCPAFTTQLVETKAANPGWDPVVFLTNTCASRLLISVLAGGSGDKVYTSSNLIDPVDPKNSGVPGVVALQAAYAGAALGGDIATVAVGWLVGEYTVNILNAAIASGSLTRQSIIEAARNLEFVPSLGREGTVYKMDGDADSNSFQSLTILQWDEANNAYIELGPEDTSYES